MSGVNKVIILGRLGQDPEVKYAASGAAVCNISIATSEKWNDKQTGEKQEKTEWHRVVFFGKRGEMVAQYFKKGSGIYVEGKLQTDKWEKEGQTHYTTKIIGNIVEFTDRRESGGGQQQQSGQGGFRDKQDNPAQKPLTNNDFADDDIPF
jgi:single-strand DNA-binding protein